MSMLTQLSRDPYRTFLTTDRDALVKRIEQLFTIANVRTWLQEHDANDTAGYAGNGYFCPLAKYLDAKDPGYRHHVQPRVVRIGDAYHWEALKFYPSYWVYVFTKKIDALHLPQEGELLSDEQLPSNRITYAEALSVLAEAETAEEAGHVL